MMMNNNQRPEPPILYYSPNCKNCAQLYDLIRQHKSVLDVIAFVDIHKIKIPNYIVKVPTIIYNGQIMSGVEAFKWVNFYSGIQQTNNNSNQPNQNQQYNQPNQNQQYNQQNQPNNRQQNQQYNQPNQPNNFRRGPENQQPNQGEIEPMECGIDGKNCIGFDVLDEKDADDMNSYSRRFSYLDENNKNARDGLASADHDAALDPSMSRRPDKETNMQYEQLQKMRSQGY